MEICTFDDLAEFICEMAENIHTFGGSPIFSYGHPGCIILRVAQNIFAFFTHFSKSLWQPIYPLIFSDLVLSFRAIDLLGWQGMRTSVSRNQSKLETRYL